MAETTCTVQGCTRARVGRGYCNAHYRRFMSHGDPLAGGPPRRRRADPDPGRVALEFFRQSIVVTGTGCWEWQRSRHSGYGQIKWAGKSHPVHRWAYERFVGPVPDGLVLDHLCRNRSCANPAHMEPVTNEENLARGAGFAVANGMRTACVNGHEYTPDNTYQRSDENCKRCRSCKRQQDHEKYLRMVARKRAA